MIKNVANILTGFRILGSILLLFFPVFSEAFYSIYLLCGFSDMIDGTIARKTNSASEFVSLHTIMNKVTGLLLFLFPLSLSFVELKYSSFVVCSIATFSAIQEGVYIVTGCERK